MFSAYGGPLILLISIFGQINVQRSSVSASALSNSINKFAIDLYGELVKNHWNFVCSPFSLSTAMSTLLFGARKNTALEIKKTLYLDDINEQEMETAFQRIFKEHKSSQPGYELEVTNTIWIQKDMDVFSNFTDVIDKAFSAIEKRIEFKSEKATKEINDWINKATNGKIQTIFDEPLDKSIKLVLANVIFFHGSWAKEFKTAKSEDFMANTNGNFRATKSPMMNLVHAFPYSDNLELNAQILELPYKGAEVSMIVFLPKEYDGLDALEKILTFEKISEAISNLKKTDAIVKLPKFNISSFLNLAPVLQSLGIQRVFVDGLADLSGISKRGELDLSKVVQKAIIEVNEKGTIASAATGAVFLPYSAKGLDKVVFSANHPFLYIIWHKSSGIILFMGRVQTV